MDPSTFLWKDDATMMETLAGHLQQGDLHDVSVLTFLAATVLLPATLYRAVYSFSVGYAYSVTFIASLVLATFPVGNWTTRPEGWLAVVAILYGLRLGTYIFLRDFLAWRKFEDSSMEKMSAIARVVLALVVSLLYALMTLPILTTLRYRYNNTYGGVDETSFSFTTTCLGTTVAWTGFVLEAVADTHKSIVKERAKRQAKKNDDSSSSSTFVGPVGGLYSITRHPNYTSEMIFWMGIWLAGVPSYQRSAVTWIAATVGMISLVCIMFFDGTPRTAKSQQERYGGQPEFEGWKRRVPAKLVPGLY